MLPKYASNFIFIQLLLVFVAAFFLLGFDYAALFFAHSSIDRSARLQTPCRATT
jgi:hypothetical protein